MFYTKKNLNKKDLNNIINFGVYAVFSEGSANNTKDIWMNPIPIDKYQKSLIDDDYSTNGIDRGPNFRADHSTPFFEIPENHPVIHENSHEERYIRDDNWEYEEKEELGNTPREYLITADYYDKQNGAFKFNGKESEYIVKSGDNLSKIGKLLGIPVPYLKKINNLNDKGLINVGQKLKYRPLSRYDLYKDFTPGYAVGTMEHEGYTQKTKRDSSGKVVGGFGHSPSGKNALSVGVDVSKEQALKWWNEDMSDVLNTIRNHITNRGLTKDQLDALVDWGYHKGVSDLRVNVIPLVNRGLMREADNYMFNNAKNTDDGNILRKNYRRWKIRSGATFPTMSQLFEESMLNDGDPNSALSIFRRDSIPQMKFKTQGVAVSQPSQQNPSTQVQKSNRNTNRRQRINNQVNQTRNMPTGEITHQTPTISHILTKMGIDPNPRNINAVLRANPGKNPNRLRVGEKINIPPELLNINQ